MSDEVFSGALAKDEASGVSDDGAKSENADNAELGSPAHISPSPHRSAIWYPLTDAQERIPTENAGNAERRHAIFCR